MYPPNSELRKIYLSFKTTTLIRASTISCLPGQYFSSKTDGKFDQVSLQRTALCARSFQIYTPFVKQYTPILQRPLGEVYRCGLCFVFHGVHVQGCNLLDKTLSGSGQISVDTAYYLIVPRTFQSPWLYSMHQPLKSAAPHFWHYVLWIYMCTFPKNWSSSCSNLCASFKISILCKYKGFWIPIMCLHGPLLWFAGGKQRKPIFKLYNSQYIAVTYARSPVPF